MNWNVIKVILEQLVKLPETAISALDTMKNYLKITLDFRQ